MSGLRSVLVAAALAFAAQGLAAQQPATLEPIVGASRDSDGNLGLRFGLAVEGAAGPRVRLGVEGSRSQVEDGIDRVRSYQLAGRLTLRSAVPDLRFEAALGGTVLDPSGVVPTETLIPTGRLRLRWRRAPGGAGFDLRARRGLLDASPDLMANRVIRSELGGTLDLPVAGRIKLRGTGRVTDLADRLDRNLRTAAGGMLVLAVAPAVEITGQVHRIAYDHFSTAGYFAPRLVQVAQIGSYGELEKWPVTFSYDVAAGAQRLANRGVPLGPWGRALSFWSQLGWVVSSAA